MPDEPKKDEETQEVESTEEESSEEKPADERDETSTEEDDDKEQQEELDLDRAKAKIVKANDEAKGLRVKLREAEDKLKAAKTPEEVDAIVKQMTEDREKSERSLLIENVALKHKLPDELAELLKGDTREELEAHAKKLQKFAPSDEDDDEDVELEGGLTPRDKDDDPNDPAALANKYGRRGRRRR